MPRSLACIALFTAVIATGAFPRTALASCSGNTCSFGRFGKITVLPAKASSALPLLAKLDTTYDSTFSAWSQALDVLREVKSLTNKFGTKEQIAAEAVERRAKNETLKKSSNDAAIASNALHVLGTLVMDAQGHLAAAKTSLQLAKRELQNVQDKNRVSELRAAAERAQSLDIIFDAAVSAGDAAKAITKGEVTYDAAKAVLGGATKLIGAFRAANLQKQADDLDAAVKKTSEDIGKQNVAKAAKELMQAQSVLNQMGPELQAANTNFENSIKLRDADYNKGAAPKFGHLDDINKADEMTKTAVRLLKQCYTDAYTLKQTTETLERSGDWMAPPQNEGVQALHTLKDKAASMFKDCNDARPDVEKVQKLIQDAYAAANESLNSKL